MDFRWAGRVVPVFCNVSHYTAAAIFRLSVGFHVTQDPQHDVDIGGASNKSCRLRSLLLKCGAIVH